METLHTFPPEPTTQTHPEPPSLQYPPALSNASLSPPPLVIDFGSYEVRAGWGGAVDPEVVFRALTCKAKDGAGDFVTVVGNQVKSCVTQSDMKKGRGDREGWPLG